MPTRLVLCPCSTTRPFFFFERGASDLLVHGNTSSRTFIVLDPSSYGFFFCYQGQPYKACLETEAIQKLLSFVNEELHLSLYQEKKMHLVMHSF